jgi:hypothetical protein
LCGAGNSYHFDVLTFPRPKYTARLAFLALVLAAAACSREKHEAEHAAPSATAVAENDPFAMDRAPYTSPRELCDYLNAGREAAYFHRRFRGDPWRGFDHDSRTWPTKFSEAEELDAEAQKEANALAGGATPPGRLQRDSSARRPIWFDGIDTERMQISAQDRPGDFDASQKSPASRAALVHTNGVLREGLLHHDTGGEGPVLARIGCGGARAADGQSRWWVVVLRP